MKEAAILVTIVAAFATAFFVPDSSAQQPKPQPDLACSDKLPDLEKLYPGDLESRRKAYGWNRFVNDRIPSQPTTYLDFEYPALIGKETIMKRERSDGVPRAVTLNVYRVTDWNKLPKYEEAEWLRNNDYRGYWDGSNKFPAHALEELKKLPKPRDLPSGLTRYEALRFDRVFFHPTGLPSGPYGLPKINCRALLPVDGGRLTVCDGRLRIEPDLLVLYSLPASALSCWASVEESIRRVVRFTQAPN